MHLVDFTIEIVARCFNLLIIAAAYFNYNFITLITNSANSVGTHAAHVEKRTTWQKMAKNWGQNMSEE